MICVLGQLELFSDNILDRGVAVVVVLFFLWGLAWSARQLLGKEGAIPQISTTLIELKDLHASQQVQCTRHAASMEHMAPIKEGVGRAVEASESVAESWAGQDAEQFKVIPVLDALLKGVDAAEAVTAKCDCDFQNEVRSLRAEILTIKGKIQSG